MFPSGRPSSAAAGDQLAHPQNSLIVTDSVLTLPIMADYMPPTFSVECVEYRGGSTRLDIKEVWYTVERVLQVAHEQIDGVQPRNFSPGDGMSHCFQNVRKLLTELKLSIWTQNFRFVMDK